MALGGLLWLLLAAALTAPALVGAQTEATPSVPAPDVASATPMPPDPGPPSATAPPIISQPGPPSATVPEPSQTPASTPSLPPTATATATALPTATAAQQEPPAATRTTPARPPSSATAQRPPSSTPTPSRTTTAQQLSEPIATGLIVNLTATPPAVGAWGLPQLLSASEKNGWFPDVAVDQAGTVHVVWSAGRRLGGTDYDVLMYTRRGRDGWSRPADVFSPGTGGFASRNSMAVTRDGRLTLLVRSQSRVTLHKVDPRSATQVSPAGWRPLQSLNGNGNPYYVLLREDASGVLYAFWTETTVDKEPSADELRCNYCAHVFSSRSSDGGQSWTRRSDLTAPLHAAARFQVALDQQDRLHAIWDDGKDSITGWGKPRSVIYRRSDDGLSWTTPYTFTLPDVQSEGRRYANAPVQSAIAVDGAGNPLVVFRSTLDGALLMARSLDGGASWSAIEQIPNLTARAYNDTPWDSYALATDGAGTIHLLAVGYAADLDEHATPGLYHLAWDGAGWSAPELITHDARYPEWPRLTIAEGNQLHAVWFTRNADDIHNSDDASYQIWYARRSLAVRRVTPQPTWTAAPSPTTEPSPTTLAPTLLPTLDPVSLSAPPVTNFTSHELMAVQIGAIALAPGVLILGLLIALQRRKKR